MLPDFPKASKDGYEVSQHSKPGLATTRTTRYAVIIVEGQKHDSNTLNCHLKSLSSEPQQLFSFASGYCSGAWAVTGRDPSEGP